MLGLGLVIVIVRYISQICNMTNSMWYVQNVVISMSFPEIEIESVTPNKLHFRLFSMFIVCGVFFLVVWYFGNAEMCFAFCLY